jgi:hypothetical protein
VGIYKFGVHSKARARTSVLLVETGILRATLSDFRRKKLL